MAEWKSFSIQLPGKDLLEEARNALETLVIFLEVLKAILETIKIFLVDFGNPVKALVEALLQLIVSLLESLKRTGFYAYYDIPDPLKDSKFVMHFGGYQTFALRFKQSLLDSQDFNRPQPIGGATRGGYILIAADAQGPTQLLALINTLLTFFGQDFLKPNYGPPSNVRAIPVGDDGDPILSVISILQKQVESIALEWGLSSQIPSNDPAFEGIASQVSQEFFPPKWFIEKSEVPLNDEVQDSDLSDASKAGFVTTLTQSTLIDPRSNEVVTTKVRVRDSYGDAFIKFQKFYIVSGDSNPATFILGQLGTFRWIDNEIEFDKTYFYRVRAYSGTLSFEDDGPDLILDSSNIEQNLNDGGSPLFVWPSKDKDSKVVMGKPSGIIRIKVPKLPADFDVFENLRHLFLTAFSFNFHLPLPPPVASIDDATGKPKLDADKNPIYLPQFDSNGDPIPPLNVTDIGKGTLTRQAGALTVFDSIPVLNLTGSYGSLKYEADPTGESPLMPWQVASVRYQAARLSVAYGAHLLEAGSDFIEGFRRIMQDPYPEGVPPTAGQPKSVLAGTTNLEGMCFALTQTGDPGGIFNTPFVVVGTVETYGTAFEDEIVRKNLLVPINYLLSLGGQGVPPNWIRVSLLRDIIPWSGQLLYDLLAKIQALLDAFKGVIDEIKAFIDLIIRKIDTLERFLEFLIAILNYIESLSVGFYLLNSGTIEGGTSEWIQTLDQAGGDIPPSGPGGYTAGIAIAYLAPNVGAFTDALDLIF